MSIIVKVVEGQNLFDISIQEYGNVSAVFDIAFANDLNVSDLLLPGQELLVPESKFKDESILSYLKKKRIHPNSSLYKLD
jgi:AAA+ ATPase superfamily predicted ATPase